MKSQTKIILVEEDGEVAPGQEHVVEQVEDVDCEEKTKHQHRQPHKLASQPQHLGKTFQKRGTLRTQWPKSTDQVKRDMALMQDLFDLISCPPLG